MQDLIIYSGNQRSSGVSKGQELEPLGKQHQGRDELYFTCDIWFCNINGKNLVSGGHMSPEV